MRPRGEIRQALCSAAAEVGGGATWRSLAARANVGFDAARRTVDNMAAAGELIVIGHHREPGVSRPMNLYALAVETAANDGAALEQVVRCWADFR